MSDLRFHALLLGSGRSGTTLLAKLVDASEDVLYRHEPDISRPTREPPFLPNASEFGQHVAAARDYLGRLATTRDERTVGSPPYFRKSFRSPLGELLWRANAYGAKALDRAKLKAPVFDWTSRPPVLIGKSVSSVARAPLFRAADPELKIVHIARHPCAVLASRITGQDLGALDRHDYADEAARIEAAEAYRENPDYVAAYGYPERVAYMWMVHNDGVHRALEGDPNYFFVQYEDLCLNLEARAREIYAFLGLEWGAQVQAFIRSMSEADAASTEFFSVVRNSRSGLYKWREKLSAEDIAAVAGVVSQSGLGAKVLAFADSGRQAD